MPRSAAGKAARERNSPPRARGSAGTGGRGRVRAGKGRSRRSRRSRRSGDEWHGAGARAAAESRDDGVDPDAPTAAYDDDDDDDPVAAVGAGDAYQALLASLAGTGEDPADDEFADALAANDESDGESDHSEDSEDSDHERPIGKTRTESLASEASEDDNASVSTEEEREGDEGDASEEDGRGEAETRKDAARINDEAETGGSDDEAAANEGDEEDLDDVIIETSSVDEDFESSHGASRKEGKEGQRRTRQSPSVTGPPTTRTRPSRSIRSKRTSRVASTPPSLGDSRHSLPSSNVSTWPVSRKRTNLRRLPKNAAAAAAGSLTARDFAKTRTRQRTRFETRVFEKRPGRPALAREGQGAVER